jgi:hypothetical protein
MSKAYLKSVSSRRLRSQEGYLMLEMLIALGAMATFSLSVGILQAYTAMIQKDAMHYFHAVTLIDATFEALQRGQLPPSDVMISLTLAHNPSYDDHLDIVTVSAQWHDTRGNKRTIHITGGILL